MGKIVDKTYILAVLDAIAALDWVADEYDDCLEFRNWSPAGESLSINVPFSDCENEKLKACLKKYAESFDEAEHVEEMIMAKANGLQGVPEPDVLVEDAAEIKKMLRALTAAIDSVELYEIPVVWQCMGYLECYGSSQFRAAQIAAQYDSDGMGEGLPLPDNSSYLEESFEIDWDGIESDEPKLTNLQQCAYDDAANYTEHGCSHEKAIQIVDENIPRFWVDMENGAIIWAYYKGDSEEPTMRCYEADVEHWMKRYEQVANYLNEENASNFFEEMEENCAYTEDVAPGPNWDELAKGFWSHPELEGYSCSVIEELVQVVEKK